MGVKKFVLEKTFLNVDVNKVGSGGSSFVLHDHLTLLNLLIPLQSPYLSQAPSYLAYTSTGLSYGGHPPAGNMKTESMHWWQTIDPRPSRAETVYYGTYYGDDDGAGKPQTYTIDCHKFDPTFPSVDVDVTAILATGIAPYIPDPVAMILRSVVMILLVLGLFILPTPVTSPTPFPRPPRSCSTHCPRRAH